MKIEGSHEQTILFFSRCATSLKKNKIKNGGDNNLSQIKRNDQKCTNSTFSRKPKFNEKKRI
jgi:hypothetical protein